MKIKRFVACNMRQALLRVRKEQGPNAVILSNGRVEGGIEVVAAIDYDETLINPSFVAPRKDAADQILPPPDETTNDLDVAAVDPMTDEPLHRTTASDTEQLEDAEFVPDEPYASGQDFDTRAPDVTTLREEIHGMRTLLEDQLSSLAWNDEVRRDPAMACILRHFAAIGLDADVARDVAALAVEKNNKASYVKRASGALAASLPVLDDSLIEKGGVVAVVGPTGVGKTTSIAKLAARFALRHGRDQVALVSTDSFRIGAQEQLATFAQILDVPVHMVTDDDDLAVVLDSLADKKLVLIDTAGVSQRAQGLAKHLEVFGTGPQKIQMYLALAANSQSETLDEVVREFGRAALDGCLLTKVDEAGSLGAVFSAVIRHKLPVAYIANGQRVPEDLHAAAGKMTPIVNYGMRLMRESRQQIGEEFMARNFGEVRTHAYA